MDAKPKRRWFRYSLRTLLVLVTIASAGFGWLGVKVRAKQRERAAVKAIREKGGQVSYDYEFNPKGSYSLKTFILAADPPGPKWLREVLGDDFFADVVRVDMPGLKLSDVATLSYLYDFPRLKFVDLWQSRVSDADIYHIQGLSQLESLSLQHTDITDSGLWQLKGMTGLKRLNCSVTQVTGAGVQELQRALPNLTIKQ